MIDVQLTDNHRPLGNLTDSLSVSPELFDSPLIWASSPVEGFASWIARENVANSTRLVRKSMWNKFIRYLDSFGVSLAECESHHISGFIAHASLEKEQAWRYVKLIERVFVHLNGIGVAQTNPARSAGRKGVDNRNNDPMRFLDNEERQKLTKFILSVLRHAEGEVALRQTKETKKTEYAALWAGVRDAAVAAVLVGAGVKVGELVTLSVNCTSEFGVLIVLRSGFNPERRIPLLPEAVEALRVWMLFREEDTNLGSVLFPAVISRRRDDQRTQTATMHPSTVHRRTLALLNEAGICDARACSQTLRNTYAAWLIESGKGDEDIIEALGYKKSGFCTVPHLRQEHRAFFGERSVR